MGEPSLANPFRGSVIVTLISDAAADKRRLTMRIAGSEMVRILMAMSQAHGGDLLRYMMFTAIWTSNSAHLTGSERFAQLHDIPPDAQRRPVSEVVLREILGVPDAIFDAYLADLIATGDVERVPGGLLVPGAVFGRPDQLANANEFYTRFVNLVARLRTAGFRFGEESDSDKLTPASPLAHARPS
jgi:hypothetical protein